MKKYLTQNILPQSLTSTIMYFPKLLEWKIKFELHRK